MRGLLSVAATLSIALAIDACRVTQSEDGAEQPEDGKDPGSYVDPNAGPPLPQNAAWVPVPSGTTVSLAAIWISADASLAVAVGDGGTVLLSSDRGATWTTGASGVTKRLNAVWGSGRNDVYVVGED